MGHFPCLLELLRERESDILSPQELASRHPAYRWRILVGPTYRADMLAHLENNPGLSASELARLAYGSFATAHEVKRVERPFDDTVCLTGIMAGGGDRGRAKVYKPGF